MIALDVAVLLNFSSDKAVKKYSKQFLLLIKFSDNLTKEEKDRLIKSLNIAKEYAHETNIRNRVKDLKLRPINSGGWKDELYDSIKPNENNSHHFAAYLLASILMGPKFASDLDKYIDFYNPGDQRMANLAASASYSDYFWENPSFWLFLIAMQR